MNAVKILVTGDVQGVFYRFNAKKEAAKLGISGWAKNQHDGGVTIFAQGNEEAISQFIEWAKVGSPMSSVENISVEDAATDEKITGFSSK